MRKVVVAEFMSLDGVVEDPGGSEKSVHGGWTFPYWNDELAKFKYDELFASDAQLLGRVTYEGFAAAWPSRAGDEFADRMNSVPKYVVSTTLKKADWNNSHIIKANVAEEITRIKQQPGQDILLAGSVTLVQALIKHDLVDEYHLVVYPIVLGSGKRLFREGSKTALKLVDSKRFGSGMVVLIYQPDRKA